MDQKQEINFLNKYGVPMQEQRFLQITDKLARKGYNLYQYDQNNHALSGSFSMIISGTSEKTMHAEKYYIFITYHSMDSKLLRAIKFDQNLSKHIFDVDEDYIICY